MAVLQVEQCGLWYAPANEVKALQLTGQLKGRRPGSFWTDLLATYGASSFINSNACQWCGQLRLHEPVYFA
jgi:hypothetical protein